MKLFELKELLERITSSDALVCIGHEDDNFFDGEVVTGMMIQHQFENGEERIKVTIIGDASVKQDYR